MTRVLKDEAKFLVDAANIGVEAELRTARALREALKQAIDDRSQADIARLGEALKERLSRVDKELLRAKTVVKGVTVDG